MDITPTKSPNQRSVTGDLYLSRFIPSWTRPPSWSANAWRSWVFNQPIATICRQTLISAVMSLEWKITPRDMKYKDELSASVKYYTNLFERGGNNPELTLDYPSFVEWILGDLLDTPGGGWAEIGRKGDSPSGRVLWVKPLDSGTMYPTLNKDYPAIQYVPGVSLDAIPFPRHAIARAFMTPRSWIGRQGWGISPPESVFFALELLNRGDKYYANLLLDVPTAGILDLGDMEKSSAMDWVDSFRTFMNEVDTSFKVPVLYEHNNPVSFIPFGKVPNDIMFDNITMKYAAIVAAAYGLTLGDIGLHGGSGETLAGSIRSERKTKRTGIARIKAKLKYFFDQILPPTLQFHFIDYDDELNVAMGRARLASATSFRTFADLGIFSPKELRRQAIADGLVSVTLPDEPPPQEEFALPQQTTSQKEKEGMKKPKIQPATGKVGNPVPPSSGGEGEFTARSLALTPNQKSELMASLYRLSPVIVEFLSMFDEDSIRVGCSELKSNPEILKYLRESAESAGNDGYLYLTQALDGLLRKLSKLEFDNLQSFSYDIIDEYISEFIRSDE